MLTKLTTGKETHSQEIGATRAEWIELDAKDRLETERLKLRPPSGRDLQEFTKFALSERGACYGPSRSMDSAWRIWCIMYGHWVVNGYGVFVLETETDGRAVGYAGPFRPEGFPENEIGWTIWNEIDEGNGFAEEATRSVLDYCREDLGWTEIVSYIVPSLSRAVSFAIKMGAVLDAAASKPAWEPDALVYRYLK